MSDTRSPDLDARPSEDVEKGAEAIHGGKGCTCRLGAKGDAQAVLSAANHAELLAENERLREIVHDYGGALVDIAGDFGEDGKLADFNFAGKPEDRERAMRERAVAALASSLETDTEDGGRDE